MIVCLVESAMVHELGFDITCPAEVRKDAFLFGEAQSRVVVSVAQSMETEFIDHMIAEEVPFSALGHVTKAELRIDDISFGFISDIKKIYMGSLEKNLEN